MGRMAGLRVDLRGKTCLVTGATSGIGRASAVALAGMGAKLFLLCRDPARAEALRAEIADGTGRRDVAILLADLSSQRDIRRAAAEFLATGEPLHVLLNNAGVVQMQRTETVDGIETTFAVNHLAYFLLTNLLLERIVRSAPARIVNVASDAHRLGGALDFDDLGAARRYSGMAVYGRSKLANLYFTRELARRLEGSGVTVNAVHPGAVRTGLGQNNDAPVLKLLTGLVRPFFRSPERGAETSIWLCSSPDVAGVSGGYFADCKPRSPHRLANDEAASRRLWDASAELTGLPAQAAAERCKSA
jgi:NAD(P)-dependent dehydrogenase (short-subunit alcohol dehydrogenase family)